MTFSRIHARQLRHWQLYLLAAIVSLLSSMAAGRWVGGHWPHVHDEFAYLLQGETFAAGRLTNPQHPLADFFQASHVLTEPTHTGKYPPGHAVFLALGIHLGNPIYGVWIENAVFAASLAWMLAVFFPVRWAMIGTFLGIIQLGGLYYWTQSFWITPMAAAGGALVWGGAFALNKRCARTDGLLLGLGVAFLMFSRPFEGLLACIVPAGVVGWTCLKARGEAARNRLLLHGIVPASATVIAAFVMLGAYNHAVTGSFFRLPYLAYEARHSGAPLFVWQKQAEFDHPVFSAPFLNAFHEQYVAPMSQLSPLRWVSWSGRMREFTSLSLGWFLAPLAALGAILALVRSAGPWWAKLAVATFMVCSLSFLVTIWFDLHYYTPFVPVLLLLAVFALRQGTACWPRGQRACAWLAALAVAGTVSNVVLVPRVERSLEYFQKNHPITRLTAALGSKPENFLVLVDVRPPYRVHRTYVANEPDIDKAKVVWAWDLGPERNREIVDYYRDRRVLRMQVSDLSIEFSPYGLPKKP